MYLYYAKCTIIGEKYDEKTVERPGMVCYNTRRKISA